jgi:RHS repeat-associated protein
VVLAVVVDPEEVAPVSPLSCLIGVVRLQAASQGSSLSRKAVWLAGLAALAVVLLALPAMASAAVCTNTYKGPAEGEYQVAANWSAEHVPTSSDVVCVGAGETVKVTEGTNLAGILQVEGTLVISGGTLEVSTALEVSMVNKLTVSGGTLTGAATVEVSSELSWTSGTMSGSGSTVLLPGTVGSLALTGSSFLVARSFINEGTMTLSSGQLWLSEGAELKNPGTFDCNSSSGIAAGAGASAIINKGVFQKTEGEGTTAVAPKFENTGTLAASSGTLEFASGTELILNEKSIVKGTILLAGASVTAGSFDGHSATITQSGGTFTVTTGSTATVGKLSFTGGTLTGPGKLEVSGELSWSGGTMSGNGSTVLSSTSTAALLSGSLFLVERALVNEGTALMPSGQLWMSEGSKLKNTGMFTLNSESGVATSGSAGTITNSGVFQKTEGVWSTNIAASFENYGSISELEGHFVFAKIITIEPSSQYGGNNPSGSGQEPPTCVHPVDCATGNFFETQTDLAIGGRGVGLDLTRTYNAQAAAAGSSGAFGAGWSNSFSDHLVVEKGKAVLYQANGSTVSFTEGKGESFTPPSWSQDSMSGSAVSGYSVVLANQIKYQFEGSAGKLQSVTDRNGNQTKLAYNKGGQVETITDPAGRKITLAYNGEGLIESAKDPLGHTVKYTYEAGNLKSVTEPGEAKPRRQYGYDGSHQMTSSTDGREGKTTTEYDSSHRVISQKDPLERNVTFEYEAFHTKITNHTTGSVTDERFTSNDLPFSIIRGFGTASATTATFTYDAENNLASITDGNGHKTKYAYDGEANRTSTVDPNEHETKWTYNGTHDVLTITTPNGEKTTITRDSHGNAETVSRPAPGKSTQTTTYSYDANGNVKSMVDPLKHTWNYEYNNQGDRTSETDPEGDKRTYGYDEDSRETSTVTPDGNAKGAEASQYTTKIERDAQGRPITITDPLGHTTKYAYDANSNLESLTDANGHTTTFIYDADNEVTKTKEANGTATETGYDGAGRVTSQTDGNKHATAYVRNPVGEVTEIKDPLGRITKKAYDSAGNLTTVTDAAGRTTKYTYDPGNRLKEITYSDGKTATDKYEYDADGNRTKMTDGTGNTTYTYSILDRLTQSTDGHGNKTGYEYDLAGEQTKLTYPNGNLVTRAYDNAGRLQGVTDPSKNTTTFAYDPNSNLTTTTFPKGTNEQDKMAFNRADQQIKITMTGNGLKLLAGLAYARDNDGQVKTITTTGLPGSASASYVYDANNRLTSGSGTSYEYDAANNPTKLGSTTYVYDAGSQLKTGGTTTYGYDQLGERTTGAPKGGETTTYGYNQAGNLIQVKQSKAGSLNVNYAYNGDGLRTSQSKGKTTSFLTWDTHRRIPLILSDEQNNYIYGPGNIPIEEIQSKGAVLYLHDDQQGSTRMLTSSTGTIEATMTYDSYGNPAGSTGSAATPIGYDGQYTNTDTGLIYLRARTYDPATAQFLTADPLRATTWATYNYTYGNPINETDPTGLCNENPVSVSFWTEGNCLSGAVGGPNGGGSQPTLWGIPAYAALTVPCLFGAEALCGGAIAASAAATLNGNCTTGVVYPNYSDPTQPPGPGWEWRGNGPVGSRRGNWYNPETDQSLHPDLNHPPGKAPHYDYYGPDTPKTPLFPGDPVPEL